MASIYNEICFIAHCHLCFRAIGQPSNYLDRIGRLIWQLNRSLFEGLSYSSYIFLQCSSLSTLWFIEIHFSLHAKMQRMKMYQIIQTSLLSKWHCCPNWEKSGESQRKWIFWGEQNIFPNTVLTDKQRVTNLFDKSTLSMGWLKIRIL